MISPRVFCAWDFYIDDFAVPIDIYCDGMYAYFDAHSDAVKILWLVEPVEIAPANYKYARANYSKYDFVFTWDASILSSLPNAVYFRNDMCWIGDYMHTPKQFGVSTVVGFKTQTVGHRMRHELWNKRHLITQPKAFYTSVAGGPAGDLVLGPVKNPLFDYQFHVAIENVQSVNMISEKLTDACRAMSVPIYWGCPNVGDTYDERGILICSSVDDIVRICNSITPEMYCAMMPYMEANYQRSLELVPLDQKGRISETISAVINRMGKSGTNIF